jgi:hypothetical protein
MDDLFINSIHSIFSWYPNVLASLSPFIKIQNLDTGFSLYVESLFFPSHKLFPALTTSQKQNEQLQIYIFNHISLIYS